MTKPMPYGQRLHELRLKAIERTFTRRVARALAERDASVQRAWQCLAATEATASGSRILTQWGWITP